MRESHRINLRLFKLSLSTILFWLVPYAAIVAWLWTLNCDSGQTSATAILTIVLIVSANMKKWSLIIGASAALLAAAAGIVAWFGSVARFEAMFFPGVLFSFFCLCGDGYDDTRDMMRHAIPSAIGIYAIGGLFLGGVAELGVNLFHRVHRSRII